MKIGLITDTHLGERAPALNANARAAMAFFDKVGAGLAIHLGDVTLDAPARPEELDFAKGLFAGFRTPVRCIPGNHDIGDNPGGEADPDHPAPDARRLAAWRQRFGDDRWAAESDGWTMIGLNASCLVSATPRSRPNSNGSRA
ncbi:MAG TPA: metallophosphoesterase [Caulobacteraceae bacterium]|nr:metallophosphoesterase [Caulobacteraceae bacterium]